MIALKYAKKILNALFATQGVAGMTAEEEGALLDEQGIPSSVSGLQYYEATFVPKGQEDDIEAAKEREALYKKYENWRTLTNQSEWFKAVQTPEDQAYRPELGVADDGTVIYGDPYYGWYRSKQTVQTSYYPTGKYLALFTSMPDETGANYTEPTEETTYQRINLDTGYFTRLNVMDDTAVIDTDNGGATIANKDVIYYPEVVDVDWGTIVGFGIFEDKDVATGEPYLWGKLNESVLATVDHVPLFRKQGFKLSLK